MAWRNAMACAVKTEGNSLSGSVVMGLDSRHVTMASSSRSTRCQAPPS